MNTSDGPVEVIERNTAALEVQLREDRRDRKEQSAKFVANKNGWENELEQLHRRLGSYSSLSAKN